MVGALSRSSCLLPLPGALDEAMHRTRDATAVVGAGQERSWASVWGDATRAGQRLAGRPGRLGVLGVSGIDLLTLFLATSLCGRELCTLHHDWSASELAAAVEDAGITEIVTDRPRVPGSVRRVGPRELLGPGPAVAAESVPRGGDANPVFYVGFTSGSSGRPKPFARRQRSWSDSFAAAADLQAMSSRTTTVLAGNLQHSHFLFGAILGWSLGAPIRLHERFDARTIGDELAGMGPTALFVVPTMLTAFLESGMNPAPGVEAVVVSGAKFEPHHRRAAVALFPNAAISELYGSSETSFISVSRGGAQDEDPGYVGHPFPGVELEIRPRAGDPDGLGLVYVRSPFLFEGYLDGGTLVTGVPDDGFTTVGDVGTIRPDGGVSLRGRASNLLITGGKNVHPEVVERAILEHPAVAECVVVGPPHEYWGQELVGCVVTRAPGAVDGPGLVAHLRPLVAAYKVPKRWVVVDRLPRLRSGKVDRRRVLADVTSAS